MASDEDDLDVDMLTAALRADAADVAQFVEALAEKLDEALPGRVDVDRRRSGLRGPRRVRRIVLRLDSCQPEVVVADGGVEAVWTKVSGGVALKHERIDFDEWLRRLSELLALEAQRSERTREALRRMLI